MQYLCLLYRQSERWEALPASEQEALLAASHMIERHMLESGHLLCSGLLETDDATVHVRVDEGTLSVRSAGDLARTALPDQFLLIEARDLNDAIRIAGQLPLAEAGYIEVRPVRRKTQPAARCGGSTGEPHE